MAREGYCSVTGCTRSTRSKKYVVCRPCALAAVRGRRAYLEPCQSYRRGFAWHLDPLCDECGYDSAEHPGGGRVSLKLGEIAA